MQDKDLEKFFRTFNVKVEQTVELPKYPFTTRGLRPVKNSATNILEKMTEPGISMTISLRNLERLIGMLNTKGFFHDETYDVRMREEELILENPHLKQLHDQYKTLLYLMANIQDT